MPAPTMVRQRLRWSARGQRIRRPHGSRSTDSSRPKLMRRKPWMQVSSLTISPALVFATSATAEGNGCRRPLSARVSQIVNRRSRLLLVRCEEYLVSAGSTVPGGRDAVAPVAARGCLDPRADADAGAERLHLSHTGRQGSPRRRQTRYQRERSISPPEPPRGHEGSPRGSPNSRVLRTLSRTQSI